MTLFFLFVLQANFGSAATIEVQRLDSSNLNFIFVDGEFVEGDSRRFNDIAISLDAAIVMFNSPGGLIDEGLAIGRTIYIKRFDTGVARKSTCASACGLAWLAGREKFVFPSSEVGFHAIYTKPGSSMRISSAGNALVGAYLHQLGFSDELIVYATDTEPTSMRWLTASDAERFRLNVSVMADDNTPDTEREFASYPIPARVPVPTWRPSDDLSEKIYTNSEIIFANFLRYQGYEYYGNDWMSHNNNFKIRINPDPASTNEFNTKQITKFSSRDGSEVDSCDIVEKFNDENSYLARCLSGKESIIIVYDTQINFDGEAFHNERIDINSIKRNDEIRGAYSPSDYLFQKFVDNKYPYIKKHIWKYRNPDIYFSYVGINMEPDPIIGRHTFIFGYEETDRLYDLCNVTHYILNEKKLTIVCEESGTKYISFENNEMMINGSVVDTIRY